MGDRRNKEENCWCSEKWEFCDTSLHWRYLCCHRLCKGKLCKDSRVVCPKPWDDWGLLESKMHMKGPFKAWYSSVKNTSHAYTLLHDTYLFHPSRISRMSAEDIWMSQPEFQKHPLNDFKRYNKRMKILVSKKVKLASTEDAIYLEDMQYHPQKRITCRERYTILGRTCS